MVTFRVNERHGLEVTGAEGRVHFNYSTTRVQSGSQRETVCHEGYLDSAQSAQQGALRTPNVQEIHTGTITLNGQTTHVTVRNGQPATAQTPNFRQTIRIDTNDPTPKTDNTGAVTKNVDQGKFHTDRRMEADKRAVKDSTKASSIESVLADSDEVSLVHDAEPQVHPERLLSGEKDGNKGTDIAVFLYARRPRNSYGRITISSGQVFWIPNTGERLESNIRAESYVKTFRTPYGRKIRFFHAAGANLRADYQDFLALEWAREENVTLGKEMALWPKWNEEYAAHNRLVWNKWRSALSKIVPVVSNCKEGKQDDEAGAAEDVEAETLERETS